MPPGGGLQRLGQDGMQTDLARGSTLTDDWTTINRIDLPAVLLARSEIDTLYATELIKFLQAVTPSSRHVELGIGDSAAVLARSLTKEDLLECIDRIAGAPRRPRSLLGRIDRSLADISEAKNASVGPQSRGIALGMADRTLASGLVEGDGANHLGCTGEHGGTHHGPEGRGGEDRPGRGNVAVLRHPVGELSQQAAPAGEDTPTKTEMGSRSGRILEGTQAPALAGHSPQQRDSPFPAQVSFACLASDNWQSLSPLSVDTRRNPLIFPTPDHPTSQPGRTNGMPSNQPGARQTEEMKRRQVRAEAAEGRRDRSKKDEEDEDSQQVSEGQAKSQEFMDNWRDSSTKYDHSQHWTQAYLADTEGLRKGREKVQETAEEKLRKWNTHHILTDPKVKEAPAYCENDPAKWLPWFEQEHGYKHHADPEAPPFGPEDEEFDHTAEAWERWYAYENRKCKGDEDFEAQCYRGQYGPDNESSYEDEEAEDKKWWTPALLEEREAWENKPLE